jgi:hypothetical protein
MDVPFLLSRCAGSNRFSCFSTVSLGSMTAEIVYVFKCGLMWRDACKANGPHKANYTASSVGAALACSIPSSPSCKVKAGEPNAIMINATHFRKYRASRQWKASALTAGCHLEVRSHMHQEIADTL